MPVIANVRFFVTVLRRKYSMPSTNRPNPQVQLTKPLSEIQALEKENTVLKSKVAELEVKVESLEKQLHDLTDPAKAADAKAFRKSRGLS